MDANLQPGDFFVVRTNSWVGAVIRWFTRSKVNHAGIYIGYHEKVGGEAIVEALTGGTTISLLSKYDGYFLIWSSDMVPLTDAQRIGIVTTAIDYADRDIDYGFLDIFTLFLSRTIGLNWNWINQRIASGNAMICSQEVDRADELNGVHLFSDGRLNGSVTPQDLAEVALRGPQPTKPVGSATDA